MAGYAPIDHKADSQACEGWDFSTDWFWHLVREGYPLTACEVCQDDIGEEYFWYRGSPYGKRHKHCRCTWKRRKVYFYPMDQVLAQIQIVQAKFDEATALWEENCRIRDETRDEYEAAKIEYEALEENAYDIRIEMSYIEDDMNDHLEYAQYMDGTKFGPAAWREYNEDKAEYDALEAEYNRIKAVEDEYIELKKRFNDAVDMAEIAEEEMRFQESMEQRLWECLEAMCRDDEDEIKSNVGGDEA